MLDFHEDPGGRIFPGFVPQAGQLLGMLLRYPREWICGCQRGTSVDVVHSISGGALAFSLSQANTICSEGELEPSMLLQYPRK